MHKLENESEEADWWASAAGRAPEKEIDGVAGEGGFTTGLGLGDEAKQGEHPDRSSPPRCGSGASSQNRGGKGIGYQTLLKILAHEGLARERLQR